eukprot:Rhum_TRINITY_DN15433_c0_g2::Rhum_TRINITY_DN15433_c0_g2_i1::g.156875::m.156875
MELCLQTPDGETTAVEFGADAHVRDVVAAFERLMPWAMGVGTIARFRGHSVDTPLSETGVEDGEGVSVSGLSLDDYPARYHEDVLRQLHRFPPTLSNVDSKTLNHARLLAQSCHSSTFQYPLSRPLIELGGPIWALGHDTWLSDFVRPHFLSHPRTSHFWDTHYTGSWGHPSSRRSYFPQSPELVTAVLSGELFMGEPLINAQEELIAEAAEKWGSEHELCKVFALLHLRHHSVISKESATFADAVWTHKETHAPAPEFVWVQPGPGEEDRLRIPKSHCASAAVPDIRTAPFLDVRAISVAVKHGVSVEEMWQMLSAYILKYYNATSSRAPHSLSRDYNCKSGKSDWVAACWKLLALGLDPETRGARGIRGLHLCVLLKSRVGCLAFLAAGADRAHVGTIGPCFMAGKVCASDCACHTYHSGAGRLRNLEASKYPVARPQSDDDDFWCNDCYGTFSRVGTQYTFKEVLPWEEADTRVERSARMHSWKARHRKR